MSDVIRNHKRGQMKVRWPGAFDVVKEFGCGLPNVEATTRYDGAPVLKAQAGAALIDALKDLGLLPPWANTQHCRASRVGADFEHGDVV
jgi:hypothetical protein